MRLGSDRPNRPTERALPLSNLLLQDEQRGGRRSERELRRDERRRRWERDEVDGGTRPQVGSVVCGK